MGFGLLIIGDELLSGRRRDRHFEAARERLWRRGLGLSWVHYQGDDPDRIEAQLRVTLQSDDVVFSFGGIGATPDDHTRQSAARAAGVALRRHPEAVAEIEAQFGADAYPLRVRMAEFPEGSRIIPNPYNRIPGFSLGDHHFLPGFPRMAWPMLEWVLEHHYRDRFRDDRPYLRALQVRGTHETALVPLLERLAAEFPQLRLSSLPTLDGPEPLIELSLSGEEAEVQRGLCSLQEALDRGGFPWQPLP